MRFVIALFAVGGLAVQGGSAGVQVWRSTEIAAKGTALAQKLDAQKVATEVIAKEGNRTFVVAHREGSGVAEWH